MIASFPQVSDGMPKEKYAFHRAARDKTKKEVKFLLLPERSQAGYDKLKSVCHTIEHWNTTHIMWKVLHMSFHGAPLALG